jgi:hypothetical protein
VEGLSSIEDRQSARILHDLGPTHENRTYWQKEKSLLNPPTYGGWNKSPPTYENVLFTPELSKVGQITPEAVLKNHNKSQKKHKMKNQIVLDFKLVVLRSEHTIWNTLVHIFCYNFRSMLFSIIVKKYIKYTILYVHCVDVLI